MMYFNFEQFMLDNRVSIPEVAKATGIPYPSLWYAVKKGKIKLRTLKRIEEVYGDCSQYLQVEKAEAV